MQFHQEVWESFASFHLTRRVAHYVYPVDKMLKPQTKRIHLLPIDSNVEQCMICLESTCARKTMCCGQPMHQPCLRQWTNTNPTCPNCRSAGVFGNKNRARRERQKHKVNGR